jgi:DNA-binding transcriptional ArsR family regulator
MPKRQKPRLLGALANDIRFAIVSALRPRELNVSELCEALELEQSAVSHGLSRLLDDGLLQIRPHGAFRYYSVRPVMEELIGSIEQAEATVEQLAPLFEQERARRKAAQFALQEREWQMRAILMHGPVSLMVMDAEGKILVAAGEFLRRFGLKESDFTGQNAFVAFKDHADIVGNLRKAAGGETVHWRIERSGWVSDVSSLPIRNGDGRLVRVISLGVAAPK